MSTLSDELHESSLQAALAAIELYNKPDFKYREQIFSVLIINAWELLLKAQIVKNGNEKIETLYVVLPNGTYKVGHARNPITIDIVRAMKSLPLDSAVLDNLDALLEIRDTAVHLYHTEPLSYAIYALGAATLRNYQKLMNSWFGRTLLEYNFYILPLGFMYNFQTLSLLELDSQPELVATLIKSVSETQARSNEAGGFILHAA